VDSLCNQVVTFGVEKHFVESPSLKVFKFLSTVVIPCMFRWKLSIVCEHTLLFLIE